MTFKAALKRIIRTGCEDTAHNKRKLIKILEKDSKDPNWENNIRKNADDEWMLRLCMANLMEGDYSWEGWGHRIPRDGLIPDCAPWWDGKPVKRLLVLGEQGLGDEILFASMFNEIPCDEVTVECDARLVGVFKRNFPNIEFIGRKHYVEGLWGTDDSEIENREFDAQTLMGDLPTWYRRSAKDFPEASSYLKAEPDSRYLGLTGYSWIGRQGKVSLKSPQGVSLQYGVESGDHYGLTIPDIDLHDDIDGLFSVIAGLEKVVSVPTTVVHIAGALGVPTTVVMPRAGMDHGGFGKVNNSLNWRFRDLSCDWHKSVRIKR